MRISGLSVTEAIREIVTRNRSIYDCMKMDIINYTALAVKIQPNVERTNRQISKSEHNSGTIKEYGCKT